MKTWETFQESISLVTVNKISYWGSLIFFKAASNYSKTHSIYIGNLKVFPTFEGKDDYGD